MTLSHDCKPPDRLIDPEGEGVYLLVEDSWSLREMAWELLGDARAWRDLQWEIPVWMREDDEGLWHRVKPRWWHNMMLPFRWAPKMYAYLTPPPEPCSAPLLEVERS